MYTLKALIFLLFLKCYFKIFFFFFQAEDGIRDTSVTGVQTCALPICGACRSFHAPARGVIETTDKLHAREDPLPAQHALVVRSEERRVGKECRSRWSRYHEKKRNQSYAYRRLRAHMM